MLNDTASIKAEHDASSPDSLTSVAQSLGSLSAFSPTLRLGQKRELVYMVWTTAA